MYLRVQSGARDRGEHPLAALRTLRGGAECQGRISDGSLLNSPLSCPGHPRFTDEQVQGLRLRHHDELRRGSRGHPVPQRLHPRQPCAAGLLQNQQGEGVRESSQTKPETKHCSKWN